MNKINNFKFWCQKVLPLVYDDSLSYYEVLCKITYKLNEVINNINDIPEYIKSLVSDDDKLKKILIDLYNQLEEQIAGGNEKTNETASENRSIGNFVWINGYLYRVINPIIRGDKYEVGANIEKITIEEIFDEIQLLFCEYVELNPNNASENISDNTWFWYKNKLCMALKDIEAGTLLIDGVNYKEINVADQLNNEIKKRINGDIELNNKIGELSELKTYDKSSVVNSLNEVYKNIYLTPEMFGAIGDGVTDDTNAVKECINNAKENTTIFLPNTYLITESIEIYKPLNLVGGASGYDTEEITSKATLNYYEKPTFINKASNCIIISSICVGLNNITIVNEYVKKENEEISMILFSFLNGSNTNIFRKMRFNNVYINAKNADFGIYLNGAIFESEFNCVNIIYGNTGVQLGTYSSNSTSLKFTNCYMLDQSTYAYVFRNINYSSFIDCACDNDASTGYGYNAYYFNKCSNVSLINCGCEKWNHSPIRFENSSNCLINVYTALENQSSTVLDGACYIDTCSNMVFICCKSISKNIYFIVSNNSDFTCVGCNYKQVLINRSLYKIGDNYTSPKLYTLDVANITINVVTPYSTGLSRYLYADINITSGGASIKINDYTGNITFFYADGNLITVNEDGRLSNINSLTVGRHILLIPIN